MEARTLAPTAVAFPTSTWYVATTRQHARRAKHLYLLTYILPGSKRITYVELVSPASDQLSEPDEGDVESSDFYHSPVALAPVDLPTHQSSSESGAGNGLFTPVALEVGNATKHQTLRR